MEAPNKNIKSALQAAKEESRVTAQSVLQEIEPLIRDYFICRTEMCEQGLKISFLNGQNIIIGAAEI